MVEGDERENKKKNKANSNQDKLYRFVPVVQEPNKCVLISEIIEDITLLFVQWNRVKNSFFSIYHRS